MTEPERKQMWQSAYDAAARGGFALPAVAADRFAIDFEARFPKGLDTDRAQLWKTAWNNAAVGGHAIPTTAADDFLKEYDARFGRPS